jgi:spermidine synthase
MTRPSTDLPDVTLSEGDGVRFLHLDSPWVQGSMIIRKPFEIELDYVQRMMAWLLFFEPDTLPRRHAMQLGLGSGAITKFCYKKLRMRCTAVELNPQVIGACRVWFHLPADDARLAVLNADAARIAADANHHGTVDALCVDLYDHDAAGPVLDTEAFYADCRALLADGGVMTVNLFGRAASFERSGARIAAAFAGEPVWRMKPTREGNTVIIAGRALGEPPERALLEARAATIESRFGLPARKWLRMIRPFE